MNDKTKKERLNQLGNDIAWQSLVRGERTTCLPHMPFPSGAMHTGGAAVGLASALHGPPKFARTRPTFEHNASAAVCRTIRRNEREGW